MLVYFLNVSIYHDLIEEAHIVRFTDSVDQIGVSNYVRHDVVTNRVRGNVTSYVIATLDTV